MQANSPDVSIHRVSHIAELVTVRQSIFAFGVLRAFRNACPPLAHYRSSGRATSTGRAIESTIWLSHNPERCVDFEPLVRSSNGTRYRVVGVIVWCALTVSAENASPDGGVGDRGHHAEAAVVAPCDSLPATRDTVELRAFISLKVPTTPVFNDNGPGTQDTVRLRDRNPVRASRRPLRAGDSRRMPS